MSRYDPVMTGSYDQPRFAYLCGADGYPSGIDPAHILHEETDILRLNVDGVPIMPIVIDKDDVPAAGASPLDDYDTVIVGITNPDTNPRVLSIATRLLANYPGRVLNPPEAVLASAREKVSERLAAIPNFISPPTVRLSALSLDRLDEIMGSSGMTFPAIFRFAGRHQGSGTMIARHADGVAADLARARERGLGEEFYLTAFVDSRQADGLFRKFRFFYYGDWIVMRHFIVARQWSVHARDREDFMNDRADLVEEERRVVEAGFDGLAEMTKQALRAVGPAMGMDFFGLDCAILPDGKILLFEANATMSFAVRTLDNTFGDPRFPHRDRCLEPALDAFRSMLRGGAVRLERSST
jgi:hypothetical protein